MIGYTRISRAAWYAAGGFRNPRCIRKHNGRSWAYFIRSEV